MRHGHEHGTGNYGRAFAMGVALNLGFVIVEFIYGQLVHSLALVADAGHNLSDVLAALLAWGGAALARHRPTPGRTYGLRRSSIPRCIGCAHAMRHPSTTYFLAEVSC